MTKYRNKTPIEAEQFDWSIEQLDKYNIKWDSQTNIAKIPVIRFLSESYIKVEKGQWIVTKNNGKKIQVLSDDLFKQTYEEVE